MKIKGLRQFFLDVIGFNTPQAITFNLASIFLLLAVVPTDMLGYIPIKCVFKAYMLPFFYGAECPDAGLFANCECPACGMTRAMSRLMHGDLRGAYGFNRAVFILFAAMAVILALNMIRSVSHIDRKLFKTT